MMNKRKIWEWCLFMVKGRVSGDNFAKLANNYEINSVIISWWMGSLQHWVDSLTVRRWNIQEHNFFLDGFPFRIHRWIMNGLDLNHIENREWAFSQESYLLGLCGVYCCCLNINTIQDIPGVSETSICRYYTAARRYLKRQFTARHLSEMFTFHYKNCSQKAMGYGGAEPKAHHLGLKKWHRYAATVNSWIFYFFQIFFKM